ncbi:hypothetical protein DB30_02494 [Enhygromyxa salina]|uniref:Uncharacterized protein n=2 Tax=Enhygromyxa salina TaxID=215803 RepID=A0A0C2D3S0_9BACT|nr:hypothetical protein DB30_02494 [Enhygromyxa salina]
MREYFDELKAAGHPFDRVNASKYGPLGPSELADTLYDFKMKTKTSPMMQIADLFLYPICQGGYDVGYAPFASLKAASRLVDQHVEDSNETGIKYSCFDSIIKKD